MDAKDNSVERSAQDKKKRRGLKIFLMALGGLVALVLLTVLLAPTLLSSSGGKRFLLGKINNSVDGQVGMDTLSLGWLSGVKLTNLTFESGDGATQVKVDRFEMQPRLAALLGGKVDMGRAVVERPQIHLKLSGDMPTARSDKDPAEPKKDSGGGAFAMPIDHLELDLTDGQATIELADAAGVQKVVFKNIAANVALNESQTTSTLNVKADVADGQEDGTLHAEGQVTPGAGWTLEDTDGTFNVSIQKLNLESLRPLLALAGQDVQMGGVLNADAHVAIQKGQPQTIKANAVVTNFSQELDGQKMAFAEPVTLAADVAMPDGVLKINQLDVKAPFCSVACSGGMEVLDYAIAADLAKTQTFVKPFTDLGGLGLVGQLNVAGKLNMGDNKVATVGKGTVKGLLVSKDGQKAPQTDVSLDYDVAMDSAKGLLKVPSLSLAMLPGTISVKNLSLPTGDTGGAIPPITLDADAALDLGKLWPFVQVLGGAQKDLTLAGMLNAAVSVQTKDDMMYVKTDKTRIQNLRVVQADKTPFEQEMVQLTADVALDMLKQSINIKAFDMQGAQGESLIKVHKGKVEQSVKKGVKAMDGQIEAEYDLKAISSMAAPFLPQGLSVEGKRKDNFTFSSRWPENDPDKMLANLNAAAALGFAKASYMGLNFGATELTLNVKQGQAAIDLPDADVNGGKVRFAGDVNLADKSMPLKLRKPMAVVENVQIDDIISENLLKYLNPAFANSRKVSGKASLSCTTLAMPLSGAAPKDINLAGQVSLMDVRLNSPLLGLFKAALRNEGLDLFSIPASDFTVKNGIVNYAKMPMTFGGSYTMTFSGRIGIEDKSLAMNVDVPISERVYKIPLTGTLDKPQPDFGKLVLSNLAEQIPVKDEKTKEVLEKGVQIFEGILKQPQKKQP